ATQMLVLTVLKSSLSLPYASALIDAVPVSKLLTTLAEQEGHCLLVIDDDDELGDASEIHSLGMRIKALIEASKLTLKVCWVQDVAESDSDTEEDEENLKFLRSLCGRDNVVTAPVSGLMPALKKLEQSFKNYTNAGSSAPAPPSSKATVTPNEPKPDPPDPSEPTNALLQSTLTLAASVKNESARLDVLKDAIKRARDSALTNDDDAGKVLRGSLYIGEEVVKMGQALDHGGWSAAERKMYLSMKEGKMREVSRVTKRKREAAGDGEGGVKDEVKDELKGNEVKDNVKPDIEDAPMKRVKNESAPNPTTTTTTNDAIEVVTPALPPPVEVIDVDLSDSDEYAAPPPPFLPLSPPPPPPSDPHLLVDPLQGNRILWPHPTRPTMDIDEFLPSALPSRVSGDTCSWIQVLNTSPVSPCFDTDGREKGTYDTSAYARILDDQMCLPTFAARNSNRDACSALILSAAKERRDTSGKWMVFAPPSVLDALWSGIAKATARGELGSASKVAPSLGQDKERKLICVYVPDFGDRRQVKRVLENLLELLKGFEGAYCAGFKPDIFTHLDIYSGNQWQLLVCIYKVKEALDWEFGAEECAVEKVKPDPELTTTTTTTTTAQAVTDENVKRELQTYSNETPKPFALQAPPGGSTGTGLIVRTGVSRTTLVPVVGNLQKLLQRCNAETLEEIERRFSEHGWAFFETLDGGEDGIVAPPVKPFLISLGEMTPIQIAPLTVTSHKSLLYVSPIPKDRDLADLLLESKQRLKELKEDMKVVKNLIREIAREGRCWTIPSYGSVRLGHTKDPVYKMKFKINKDLFQDLSEELRSLVVDKLKLITVRVTQTSDRYFKSSSKNVKRVRGKQDNIVLSTTLADGDGGGDEDNEWCFENVNDV
ncbi:hypothetical protein TrRE_jg12271, partial [Triparma retinervis]